MRIRFISIVLACSCVVGACVQVPPSDAKGPVEQVCEDLTKVTQADPDEEYRLSHWGICGKVRDGYILVTHLIPTSSCEGIIKPGDRIVRLQGMPLGDNIPAKVRLRDIRLGRDWNWHLYVTLERDSLRGGKGNTVSFDIRIPPKPGATYHYGPTGFFAKRYSNRLVVDTVLKGSPADQKLKEADVIVAVEGKPIDPDAVRLFADAVEKAESGQDGGTLKLTVKRPNEDGSAEQTLDVSLNLECLGSYSKTAPYNCHKTDRIIERAADYLADTLKAAKRDPCVLSSGMLGLLATGEQKYIEVVADILHASTWAKPDGETLEELRKKGQGRVSWQWGYKLLVLTEYCLLTNDKTVLPSIERYARVMAEGQDSAGLWGHRMANRENGRAYGYGVMNQPSLSIFIGLILAEKCGVKDPVLRKAIQTTHDHFANWIGQGALPYGNHLPQVRLYTYNGSSGSLALAFSLLGNKKGADFFARMSAAGTDAILTSHGGPWFNLFWSGLGANLLGPDVAREYNRQLQWLRTAARGWDGRFYNISGISCTPKSGNLRATGPFLLNYCASRHAIYLTGKDMDKSIWVKAKEAKALVDPNKIGDTKTSTLLTRLGDPLPPVRFRAAELLAIQGADVQDEVMALLTHGNLYERIGAIHAIGTLKIDSAADELVAIVTDEREDLWLRKLACRQLGDMDTAKPYAGKLLQVLAKKKPYDTFRELDLYLGRALEKILSPDPYAANLDREVFYNAVSRLLEHKHGWARQAGMNLIKNIPLEDLPAVSDEIVYVIKDEAPDYTVYQNSWGRQEGLEILQRLGIKESIDLMVTAARKQPTGRRTPRDWARRQMLETFGREAKYAIPMIKEVLGKDAEEIVKKIETSQTERELISLEDLKKH